MQTRTRTVDPDSLEQAGGLSHALPSVAGRYELGEILGEGGMGVVAAAWDPVLKREVAIKLTRVHLSHPDRSRARVQQALAEARVLAAISHPNIVEVYDCGMVQGRMFIAMARVRGGSLAAWMHSNPTAPWRRVLELLVQAGRGLAAAHAAGVVHRDFKAHNVLVQPDGRAQVTDFGIAHVQAAAASEPAEPGDTGGDHEQVSITGRDREAQFVAGTPGYIAPELLLGATADPRCDQFAFCVAIHRALTGRMPYEGQPHVGDRARSIASGLGVPRRVRAAVARGLATEPRRRFASMEALLRQLDPAPRYRVAKVVALAGMTTAAVVVWPGVHRSEACIQSGPVVDGHWSPARRQAIAEAFTASDDPLARSLWSQTSLALDDYADAWEAQLGQACAGRRHDEARSEVQMACLADRRRRFAALVNTLDDPSEAGRRDAPLRARQLPPVDACGRGHPASASDSWPGRGAELMRATEVARMAAANAVARSEQGDDSGAQAALEIARKAAHDAGDRRLVAEVALATGKVHREHEADQEARLAYVQAFETATEAGDDITAAAAAMGLVYVVGHRLGRYEDAITWSEHARARAARLGPDPLRDAELAGYLGAVHLGRGDLVQARLAYLRALALREAELGLHHVTVAATLSGASEVSRRRGQLVEARAYLDRSLSIYETQLGPGHPRLAVPLRNLAAILDEQGQLDQAERIYQRALTLLQVGRGHERQQQADLLNDLAGIHRQRGDLAGAREHLGQALEIRRRTLGAEHPAIAAALTNRGALAAAAQDHQAAARDYRRALQILEPLWRPDHPRLALPLRGLGQALLFGGDPQHAVAPLSRAMEILAADPQATVEHDQVRRALGFALVESGLDPQRGRALVLASRDAATDPQERAQMDAWLAQPRE